jgi:hypothetical protein
MNNLQELQKLAGIDITESLRRSSEKIKGLEGPFTTNLGRVLYFDPKEKRFYDRKSDHYVDLADGENDPRNGTAKITHESATPEKVGLLFDPNVFVTQMEKSFKDSVESISYKQYHTDADADRADKYKLPKDVKKACNDRIEELKASIDVEDDKGYNDKSIKEQAIECIEQILQNLSANDAEGFKQSVIYLDTLMSILIDLMPSQLLKYLRVGKNYGNDPSTIPV